MNKITTLMKVETKELKWVTVESNILTKYSKSKDKQTKKFPTNAAICLVNLFLTWVCMLSCFSWVQLFSTLWTLGHQASLSMGILQARILEWSAMPSFRGSYQGSNPSLLQLLHWQACSFLLNCWGSPCEAILLFCS